jgi:hypothetical protein
MALLVTFLLGVAALAVAVGVPAAIAVLLLTEVIGRTKWVDVWFAGAALWLIAGMIGLVLLVGQAIRPWAHEVLR